MSEKIIENIKDPEMLERLYREDKKSFEKSFREIYSEIKDTEIAKFWKSRLDFEKTDRTGTIFGPDFFVMIIVCLVAGFLIKIPAVFNINLGDFLFYEKDAGIIFFLGITAYVIVLNKNLSRNNLIITILIFIISIIYINLLPNIRMQSSVNLAYIHMPFLMWCVYGLVYTDFDLKDHKKRIDFIRHNGDLAILGGLIIIAGGLLMVISVMLFRAIGISAEKFYTNFVVQVGFVSAPVVAFFILKNFATITNKLAPVIANLFSPLVAVTLVIYLIAMAVTGKDPYNDRDFLLIFNIMLIGVMAIIVFSVSETSLIRQQKFNEMVLFILSVVTIITNLIALSAIFYRLGEYGITPNRLAILGSNILIFINLIMITIDLFKINFRKSNIESVELTIAKYLPVYLVWIVIVVFGFPFIFGLR